MINIAINLSFRRFADLFTLYFILIQSLLYPIDGSTTARTTMHVTCGTDVELTCPIRPTKKYDEVISWFRPNSSYNHLSIVAIGDILLPDYAANSRFNLISSSSSSPSRLLINNISIEDQGYYNCKSSSNGQHSIKLYVNSHPHINPQTPILLYPVNRTFTITCSLLCHSPVRIDHIRWFANGKPLHEDKNKFFIETISLNTQRLTVYLNTKSQHFNQTMYTCKYDGKESSTLVRRRTKEELHRLPRQEGSSFAYLLQTATDTGQKQSQSSYKCVLIFFLLSRIIQCAI